MVNARLIIPTTEVFGAEPRMNDTLPGGTDAEETELSAVFHVLRAKRRRLAIAILDRDGEQNLRELAKKIAAIEFDTPVRSVSNDQYRNVYNSLAQMHLPTLAEEDIVKYDSDRQTIAPREELQLPHTMYRVAHQQLQQCLNEQSPND